MKKKGTLMKVSWPQRQMKTNFEREMDERDGGESKTRDLLMFFWSGGCLSETAERKPSWRRMKIKEEWVNSKL